MHEEHPPGTATDAEILLAQLPADDSAVSNGTLRGKLGWEESRYEAARGVLLERGLATKGKGRGGSLRRGYTGVPARPHPAGPVEELFAPGEVETIDRALARPRTGPTAGGDGAAAMSADGVTPVTEFLHADATRKNLPPAGSPPGDHVVEEARVQYSYDPHRPPVLRFHERITRSRELLDKATRIPLTREEATELADYLEAEPPWLEWSGKRENPHFEVEPVALHLHERVSAQAILAAVRREDAQRDFFARSNLPARDARAYYQHDVDWANRLIVGDSLQVMTSLARREGLAGKVQMIYFDPPYGIKFSSNWQNEVGKRDVKDKDEDLTREPEMIRAYRDTWTLGVHSYLAYLKQRLVLSRELLLEAGSIFVQISDENVHRVRSLLDEVFGVDNFVGQIVLQKTAGKGGALIDPVYDSLLWYAKNKERATFRRVYQPKAFGELGAEEYTAMVLPSGERRTLKIDEKRGVRDLPENSLVFRLDNLTSQSKSATTAFTYTWEGKTLGPGAGGWKTNLEGMNRLAMAGRLRTRQIGNTITYIRYLKDFEAIPYTNLWTDVSSGFNFYQPKLYVVQTNERIIERCVLMTSDPGDLVLDPTCGSGTTAEVCEHWGRRWITIDSSRVAAAIARQRLLTASYECFKVSDPKAGVDANRSLNPRHGFIYKKIPHITLRSIAQNKGLDSIFGRHEPNLKNKLDNLNIALSLASEELRGHLVNKLVAKFQTEGARNVTDADLRRMLLPATDPQLIQQQKGGLTATQVRDLRAAIPPERAWRDWEVPFDTDPEWPMALQVALEVYRVAWRAKMDEVNACIVANADSEELVHQPEVVRGVVRVSGPFTVESIRPPENVPTPETAPVSPIGGAPEELETFDGEAKALASGNAASHIDRMLALLRHDGITFLGNKHVRLENLQRIESSFLHAEGQFAAVEDGKEHRVAVVIGPEMGNVPSFLVEQAMRFAFKRGYDDLIVAGFGFDAMAQEAMQDNNDDPNTELRVHMSQIRPDVTMGDLLKKTQVTAQIFTVFGQPRTRVEPAEGEEWRVHMDGVDIYNPVENSIEATTARKVAAWFVDTDYDGKVFCICQAYFPDKSAWEKIARALKGSIEPGAFEQLSGTTSLPFKPGPRRTIAVKVIDPRGNEVMRVHRLGARPYQQEMPS